MNSGIYIIENTKNGHRYVGSAVDLKDRFRCHRQRLCRGKHRNAHLQRAWNKYGEDAFEFEVLEHWEPEFLISMEQWWMNMLHPEYNIAPVAGSNLGMKFVVHLIIIIYRLAWLMLWAVLYGHWYVSYIRRESREHLAYNLIPCSYWIAIQPVL